MNEPTTKEVLQAEALIGDEAAKFFESELGRTVLGMIEQEKSDALDALAEVDAEDSKAIRALQAKHWRADQFEAWIRELIFQGEQAIQQLRTREADE